MLGRVPGARGVWSWGVSGPRGVCGPGGRCLVLGVPGPGGVAWSQGGVWSQGIAGGLVPGGCLVETPRMATAAGGTHSTGMHSC